MFTHPALLRKLNMVAEFLRRSGEARWARNLRASGDAIRRRGWTDESRADLLKVLEGDSALASVSFGAEHERWLHGEQGLREANDKLALARDQLRDLANTPTSVAPVGPRRKSPDLE